jgi:TRAP-type mannitol/chloroaromatic compound transport system permease large subunit
MAAGFLPDLLTIVCYIAAIAVVAHLIARWAPAGKRTPWPERWRALRGVWSMVLVVRSLVPEVGTNKIFLGVMPYLVGDAVRVGLLIAFPAIVLVVPNMM